MTEDNRAINNHIEEYLNYYCYLPHAPGFAVLLKGQWGSGKTWFIKKYSEKLKEKNQKVLYVSLYGMTAFSDIENEFFKQLHPVLSSKEMAITSQIFKGVLKATIKIDLDSDSKDDGTVGIQFPDLNLPDYLKNIDESILIFDDLERCNIDIPNLLGYINYFVEHQDLKVILVADEAKLLQQNSEELNSKYKNIKEKTIGKTFAILPDFQCGLEDFINLCNSPNIKSSLLENTQLIQKIYNKANFDNLRNLRQNILDFERIYQTLPDKAQNKQELIQDVLKILIIFSIEVKRGEISPKDIGRLQKKHIHRITSTVDSPEENISKKEASEKNNRLQKILAQYTRLLPSDIFPSVMWWQDFFDKGIINIQQLEQSVLHSIYFQDDNAPNWVKLWHFSTLTDQDFENLLTKVELEYADRQFVDLREIKHITGLFLMFSGAKLYSKNKNEILHDAKLYVDYLKETNQLTLKEVDDIFGGYSGLGYQGSEFQEFQDFCLYIKQIQETAKSEKIPNDAQKLLLIMKTDVSTFLKIISLTSVPDEESEIVRYHDYPILKFIDTASFIEKFLSLSLADQRRIFWGIDERYENDSFNKNLVEELEWLKNIQSLLLEDINRRKGKITGYNLEQLNMRYLSPAIEKLEAKQRKLTS